jgi:hypothetical protein
MLTRARIAILASLAATAAVGAVTLSHGPLRVLRTSARGEETLGSTTGDASICQAGETIPKGTTAIRMSLEGDLGPPVRLRAYSGARLLTQGARAPDWTSTSVTVPVKPLSHTAAGVRLCLAAKPNGELLQLYGVYTKRRLAAVDGEGQPLPGRVRTEYLAPSRASWWSQALAVARHMGIGHALSGRWVPLLAALAMAATALGALGLAWRELPSTSAREDG